MKKIFGIVCAFAAVLLLGACQRETGESLLGKSVSADATTLTLPAEGGSATVQITADGDWVAVAPDWITLTPNNGGAGKTPVTVKAEANKDEDGSMGGPRSGSVFFLGTDVKVEVTVAQDGDAAKDQTVVYTKVTSTEDIKEGQYLIVAFDGTDWQAGKPAVPTKEGYYSWMYTEKVTVADDNTITRPDASLSWIFTATGGGFTISTVTQWYIYQSTSYDNFNYTTDAAKADAWTVTIGDDGKATITNAGAAPGKYFQYSITHTSYGSYAAPQDGATDVYLYRSDKALEAVPILRCSNMLQTVDYDATSATFDIQGIDLKGPWSVTTGADWITSYTQSGSGDGTVSVQFGANDSTAERTAQFTVSSEGAADLVLTLKQGGVPPTGQSVTEIVALPDNSSVETLESTVMALTKKGFVISDGTTAIYAYDNGDNALAIGDVVKVFATKTTYNGVPELADIQTVEKTGIATVNYPSAKDVTDGALTYEATVAEYIQFSGILKKSGNYYNVNIDGVDPSVKQGSLVYPVAALDADSYDGQPITVAGYFNGLSSGGKYLNVIAVKITAAGAKGTLANPYTPAEAADAVKDLTWTSNTDYETTDNVYVKGKICKIANNGTYTQSGTYGNASYYISADGTGDGEFYVFRSLYFGNVKYTSGPDIAVGDEVIIFGKLMNYQGTTPETAANMSCLYSLNGQTEPGQEEPPVEEPLPGESADDPLTVAEAIAYIKSDAFNAGKTFYVKGLVSKVVEAFKDREDGGYGNGTFWLSDDGSFADDLDKDFEAYRVKYLEGKEWENGSPQIAVGDQVVICGQLKAYTKDGKTTYENNSGAYVYSHTPKNGS